MTAKAIAAGQVSARSTSERIFFGGMALAMFTVVFLGFQRTYFLRPAELPALSILLQVHGLFLTAWIVLFAAQTALVSVRRVDLHRKLGWIASAVAVGVAGLASTAALTINPDPPKLISPLGLVALFVVFVALGIAWRKRPAAHKRLMLLATINLLPPAVARLDTPLIPHGAIAANLEAALFLTPLIAYDLATRRNLHPVTLWGVLAILLALIPRMGLRYLVS